MAPETRTAAAAVVESLEVGGFNSRSMEEALAAPRVWEDAHPLIVQTDTLIVELWEGPEGDRLIKFEDQSYVYFFGCTGGARHSDTPMDLAFTMPSIDKERDQWKLVFSHDRHKNGGTIHFFGSSRERLDANIASCRPDAMIDADDFAPTCMRCGASDTDPVGPISPTASGETVCSDCFDAPDDCLDDDERRAMGYDPCPGCGAWISSCIPDPTRCPICGVRMEVGHSRYGTHEVDDE